MTNKNIIVEQTGNIMALIRFNGIVSFIYETNPYGCEIEKKDAMTPFLLSMQEIVNEIIPHEKLLKKHEPTLCEMFEFTMSQAKELLKRIKEDKSYGTSCEAEANA